MILNLIYDGTEVKYMLFTLPSKLTIQYIIIIIIIINNNNFIGPLG